MITKQRRKMGLVLIIVGLIVLGVSFIVGNGNSLTRDLIDFVPVFQISGVMIAILGLLIMVAPKDYMEKRLERIDHLEKRIAQLERNQKNTP